MRDERFGSIFLAPTVLNSIGMVAVSTSRVVIEMLRSHSSSRWRSTFFPCTPILAMVPAGATSFWHSSKVAGIPPLDGGVDAALAGHLHDRFQCLAVGAVDGRRGAEAPATSRRLSSRSIMMISAGE